MRCNDKSFSASQADGATVTAARASSMGWAAHVASAEREAGGCVLGVAKVHRRGTPGVVEHQHARARGGEGYLHRYSGRMGHTSGKRGEGGGGVYWVGPKCTVVGHLGW